MIKKFKSAFIYIFLIAISFISIFPFVWMLISMTNSSADITMGTYSMGSKLIVNIYNLFNQTDFATGIKNSLLIAFGGAFSTILVSSLAGYGFEVFKSKGKERALMLLMLSMMMPGAALLIPQYRMFAKVGLTDNLVGAFLPSISSAFLIFYFRQSTKSFERELIDAARVDGLNEFSIFLRIYFPTMKSTFAAALIITFMNSWNSFMWPLVVLQSQDKTTLPVILSMINTNNNPDFGQIMVAVVIMTLPTIIIFFSMQKQFVRGMMGSVK